MQRNSQTGYKSSTELAMGHNRWANCYLQAKQLPVVSAKRGDMTTPQPHFVIPLPMRGFCREVIGDEGEICNEKDRMTFKFCQ